MEANRMLLLLLVGLAMAYLWYQKSEPESSEEELLLDWDLYSPGQIQYLTMDTGMSSCWNDTVKKFLPFVCPHLSTNAELGVEMAYLITSCFCMSIGSPPLSCRSPSKQSPEAYFHFSLIECATNKCFNQYDFDGFEIVHERISAICHYFLYESRHNPERVSSFVENSELERLMKVASGEHFNLYDTKMEAVEGVLVRESHRRREQEVLKRWLEERFQEFWLIVDDIKFKLRVGKYSGVPYY